MRIISATVGPLAASSASIISTASTGQPNVPLGLQSSPFVLDFARRIGITAQGNDSTVNFTIVGTDWNGSVATETLAGAASTGSIAQSLYDYSTITSITPSTTTSVGILVGTTNMASTRPIFLDEWAFPQAAVQIEIKNGGTSSVQQSLGDPNSLGYTAVTWANSGDAAAVGVTASAISYFAYAPKIVRLLTTVSGTTSVATIRVSQAASSPL